MERKRVGIVLFENIEVLDFCGPFEVFSVARLDEARRREEPSPFEVMLVAEHAGPVTASGGMKVIPDQVFASCPRLDILVVPGGIGVYDELKNPAMLDWLRLRAEEVETLTSVCTGAMLLGALGVLDGRHATTHWRLLDRMREAFPAVTVEYDQHVVEDGRIYTSAGISAGIDMALKVVARHYGEPIAQAAARYMEYPYPSNNERRVELAGQPQ